MESVSADEGLRGRNVLIYLTLCYVHCSISSPFAMCMHACVYVCTCLHACMCMFEVHCVCTLSSTESFVVTEDHEAELEDEISVPKGVVVQVTVKKLSGWWQVR